MPAPTTIASGGGVALERSAPGVAVGIVRRRASETTRTMTASPASESPSRAFDVLLRVSFIPSMTSPYFGRLSVLSFAMIVLVAACAPAPATPTRGGLLEAQLTSIAEAAQGAVSVTVLNLRTGERASLHGQTPRPMMSVFKLPIAVAALVDVDQGLLRLDQAVPISASELRQGGPIAEAWKRGETAPSVES